ncbi:MAG: 4Fe-4S binding protein [Oscillospiraceae bacterium]|jgi:Na+-translocating ferredoxin:NAD+ oxidoreductase RNF subunit RnfB|nr:4Fe-4S binding protein [Oscillospiraceae bacterium]
MDKVFHSVTLDSNKCVGCTNCIKRCPTEAIRVRDGKAQIISGRCIDCGQCIRICPHYAKRPVYDPLSVIDSYKYKIALPAPALYGQFNDLDDIDIILTGLLGLGFDHVAEVSAAAELISEATRIYMSKKGIKRPVISSACPAVLRLIAVRFPDLCEHVLPFVSPMEAAAMIAREKARQETGLSDDDIGIFFISPCPAKVTDVKSPIGKAKSSVTGVLAISEVFPKLASLMNKVGETEPLSQSGVIGVSWAGIGGESAALLNEQHLAADGIENVIQVLEGLEDEKFRGLDFIELSACSGGCVGGVLTVENPYVARARVQRLRKYLPFSCSHLPTHAIPEYMNWEHSLEFSPVMELSSDITKAMKMMSEIDRISGLLPGLDCGSCGAPSCRCLAEDIVKGGAQITDCVFILRERIHNISTTLASMGSNPLASVQEKMMRMPSPMQKSDRDE